MECPEVSSSMWEKLKIQLQSHEGFGDFFDLFILLVYFIRFMHCYVCGLSSCVTSRLLLFVYDVWSKFISWVDLHKHAQQNYSPLTSRRSPQLPSLSGNYPGYVLSRHVLCFGQTMLRVHTGNFKGNTDNRQQEQRWIALELYRTIRHIVSSLCILTPLVAVWWIWFQQRLLFTDDFFV